MSKAIEDRIFTAAMSRLAGRISNARFIAVAMVAQAKHETGNFRSNAFRKHNNAFGYMYYPASKYQQKKPGLIADNKLPVAHYATIEDSAKEVADWILRRKSSFEGVTTLRQFAETLKAKGYYGDTVTNYLRGLVHYAKDLNPKIIVPGVSVFLLVVGAVLFYLLK